MAEPNPTFTEEELQNEEWRLVADFPDYEVSTLGRVKRIRAHTWRSPAGKILKPSSSSAGYSRVALYDGTKPHGLGINIHVLVCRIFIGPRPFGYHINHINAIKTDNRLSNLEYATPTENVRHASRLGLLPHGNAHHARTHPERLCHGERVNTAKLTEPQVIEILSYLPKWNRQTEMILAHRFHVSRRTINEIKNCDGWKHIKRA